MAVRSSAAHRFHLPRGDYGSETLPALTAKQSRALRAILSGKSNAEAAKLAGVHANTVSYSSIHHEPFIAHLAFAHLMLFARMLRGLQTEALKSIEFLAWLRDTSSARHADRLKAAATMLRHAAWPNANVQRAKPPEEKATAAYSAEHADDLEHHVAARQMAFGPDEKPGRIAELKAKIEQADRRIEDLEREYRAQRDPSFEDDNDETRSRLSRKLTTAREVRFQRSQEVERLEFELGQLMWSQRHVLGQFEEHPDAETRQEEEELS